MKDTIKSLKAEVKRQKYIMKCYEELLWALCKPRDEANSSKDKDIGDRLIDIL